MPDTDFNPSSQDVADYLKSKPKQPSAFEQLAPGIGALLAPGLAKGAAALAGKVSPMLSALFLSKPNIIKGKTVYHNILDDTKPNAGPVGYVSLTYDPAERHIAVDHISTYGKSPLNSNHPAILANRASQAFGSSDVRSLLRSLKEQYPEAETLGGYRISGARHGPAVKDFEYSGPEYEESTFTKMRMPQK